jgi:hypothetical protein
LYTYREEVAIVDAVSYAALVRLYILWVKIIVVIGIAVVVSGLVVSGVIVSGVVFIVTAVVVAVVGALTIVVVAVALDGLVRTDGNFLTAGVPQVRVVSGLQRYMEVT